MGAEGGRVSPPWEDGGVGLRTQASETPDLGLNSGWFTFLYKILGDLLHLTKPQFSHL